MRELLPQIDNIISRIVEQNGGELVEIGVVGRDKTSILRVFVCKPGGINIGEISKLTKKISKALDEADIIPHNYLLEVSSPGLDRPLRTIRDFERVISENVRIVLPDGKTHEGTLIEANQDTISLESESESILIPLDRICSAKIIY